jgi:general secretion pathway protein G
MKEKANIFKLGNDMKSININKRKHVCRRCNKAPMTTTHYQHFQRAGGFTLIELLLVLVILTTLTAIVLPKFTGRSKEAKVTAAKTQIAELEVALDAFEIDLGRYPTTVEGLRALVQKPTTNSDGWEQPYLRREEIPRDPWGNDYLYKYPGQYNEHGYDLYSNGPDGKQGGNDDIVNWSQEQR